MTVPHDAVLCVGLGIAAHLAAPEGRPLRSATKKIALEGFAFGWIPLSSVLLWYWADWSWWYWAPAIQSQGVSLGLGLTLECVGFGIGLLAAGFLARRAQWLGLGLIGLYEVFMLTLPFAAFARVGTLSEVQAGGGTPLFEAWTLMITLAVGGLWLCAIAWWTGRRISRQSLKDARLGSRMGFR